MTKVTVMQLKKDAIRCLRESGIKWKDTSLQPIYYNRFEFVLDGKNYHIHLQRVCRGRKKLQVQSIRACTKDPWHTLTKGELVGLTIRLNGERIRAHSSCQECDAVGVRLYRWYGMTRSVEDDRCNECIKAKDRTGYVPLILNGNGDAWGFLSVPLEDITRFFALPEKNPHGWTWQAPRGWTKPHLPKVVCTDA